VKSWIRIHIRSFRGSKWSRGVPCTIKMEPLRVCIGQWSQIRITLMRSRIRIRIKVIRIRRKPWKYKYPKRGGRLLRAVYLHGRVFSTTVLQYIYMDVSSLLLYFSCFYSRVFKLTNRAITKEFFNF
jgi:hypothetical protein